MDYRIQKPVSGQTIPRGWFSRWFDIVMSFRPTGDGRTIRVTNTPFASIISAIPQPVTRGGAGAGTSIKWAKVTAVTDANNYTCDIYNDRNESTASETSKAVRVWDIADSLSVNDWFPVQSSNVTGKDYENIQQIGLL